MGSRGNRQQEQQEAGAAAGFERAPPFPSEVDAEAQSVVVSLKRPEVVDLDADEDQLQRINAAPTHVCQEFPCPEPGCEPLEDPQKYMKVQKEHKHTYLRLYYPVGGKSSWKSTVGRGLCISIRNS